MSQQNSGSIAANIMSSLNGDHWTADRKEILAWLQRHSPPLAELYAGSVLAIFQIPFPGRVIFICHAVREIRNRLPEIISGVSQGGRLDYATRIDALQVAWETEQDVKKFAGDGKIPDEPVHQSQLTLSTSLYNEITVLIKDHELARQKPEQAASLLFIRTDSLHAKEAMAPLIKQWMKVTKWFQARAHFTGKTDDEVNWDDLKKNFILFETSLLALDRQFFNTVEGLDEILDNANA